MGIAAQAFGGFRPDLIEFLEELGANNNRDWFNENKARYEALVREPALDFIAAIENKLGKKAIREELPLQPGDVPNTWADCADLERDFGYRPQTAVEEGIDRFIDWYLEYYGQE